MAGQITALEVQKRHKDRVNVYIDGEFAFGLNHLDAASLVTGQQLSDAEIAELVAKDARQKAMERALRYLSYRPRSAAEVRSHLRKKQDMNDDLLESVIARLIDLNYVDDVAFARFWIENRQAFNPRGGRALRYELRQKGIDETIISEALRDFEPQAAAYQAAQKKLRSLNSHDRDTLYKKLGGYLARRGFDYDVVRQVIEQVLQEQQEDNDTNHHDFYADEL